MLQDHHDRNRLDGRAPHDSGRLPFGIERALRFASRVMQTPSQNRVDSGIPVDYFSSKNALGMPELTG
jgi:hypothetical protein